MPPPRKTNIEAFDELTQERIRDHGPLTAYGKKQLEMARSYLRNGAPYGIDESKLSLTHGRNNFSNAEVIDNL